MPRPVPGTGAYLEFLFEEKMEALNGFKAGLVKLNEELALRGNPPRFVWMIWAQTMPWLRDLLAEIVRDHDRFKQMQQAHQKEAIRLGVWRGGRTPRLRPGFGGGIRK